MGIAKEEYLSELPLPSPGDLPNPGIEPASPALAGRFFTTESPGRPLEKTLESPLDYKGIQTVHPKGNQPWILIRRIVAKAEAPILWPPDRKSWLTGKDPDGGKVQFSLVAQSCLTFCDPMDCSIPGLPVYHQLLEFTQTHAHWVVDAIQPSHPLSSPSPHDFSLSQHQGLFKWVSSSHQVAKVLEFQLQHQSFQWTLRTDLL